MALINCKECGEQISTKASACPKCGAPMYTRRKGPSGCVMALVIIVAVVVLISFLGNINSNRVEKKPPQNETILKKEVDSKTEQTLPQNTEVVQSAQPISNWLKGGVKDEMTDKERPYVANTSLNGADFKFPYHVSGGSKATIVIRKDAKEKVAYVMVEKGQMICSYNGCSLQTKSDSGEIKSWRAQEAGPGIHNAIFISNVESFESYLKKNKKIRIGIEFYEYGIKSFDFDVSGYPGIS